ncbi:MAG: InlB B-repeat-containing protein [Muribaculaceae bacterium]|nr:InlB B-repeat-containing protein [Muribaculaceae bacterium]
MLVSAAVLIMTVWVSAYAALKSSDWSLNPSDFRYDMSLYFALTDRNLEDLDKYEIGAFIDDECCGVAEKLTLSDTESCLYMRIRSNTAQGASVEFRMRERGAESYVLLKPDNGSDFIFKSNDRVGMPSSPFVFARYFKVDVAVVGNGSVDFTNGLYKEGDQLSLKAVADEGYHFSQWSDGDQEADRTFTVTSDTSLTAFFDVDYYSIEFRIGDEVIASETLAYGAEISAPEAPAKEGYSFSGWTDCPATMPAHDVVVKGEYTINTYTVTYQIDNEVIGVQHYEFGAPIVVMEAPEKEGHTFSGWGEVPETMPAFDLVLGGTYADNYYTITFRLDGVVILTDDLPYESPITVPEVPEKEGYSFSGWGEVPATMPAYNLDIDGSYIQNVYKLIFRIDDDIVSMSMIPYGAEIVAPDAPAKVGHTFAGWGIVPATMPASDLEIVGTYDVNYYTITYDIDGEVFLTDMLPYGSQIIVPENVPEKDGHSFQGWGNVPDTMPANDITVSGTYAVNNYTLTFRIGDEVVFTGQQPYGSEIVAPEVSEKEGYDFSGWGDVPPTMPSRDLEIIGNYIVKSYKLVFKIDDEVISESMVEYGALILSPEAPEKEGYTFIGWGAYPLEMPAHDLEIIGSYVINYYHLVVYLNNDVYIDNTLPYGAEIVIPEPVLGEGLTFLGWTEEIPSVMPAHDVEIHGKVEGEPTSAVEAAAVSGECAVYSVDGVMLFKGDSNSGILDKLTPGIYIINGKKTVVK